jgi:hypothetical protein
VHAHHYYYSGPIWNRYFVLTFLTSVKSEDLHFAIIFVRSRRSFHHRQLLYKHKRPDRSQAVILGLLVALSCTKKTAEYDHTNLPGVQTVRLRSSVRIRPLMASAHTCEGIPAAHLRASLCSARGYNLELGGPQFVPPGRGWSIWLASCHKGQEGADERLAALDARVRAHVATEPVEPRRC